MKLPTSPEIKRVIAAVRASGVEVGSVTLTSEGIIIMTPQSAQLPHLSPYEKWKASENGKL